MAKTPEIKYNFVVGDLVKLKGGGPIMTVCDRGQHKSVTQYSCIWYDGSKYSEHTFIEPLLVGAFDGPRSLQAGISSLDAYPVSPPSTWATQ